MGATLGTAAMPPSGARTGGAREVASPSGSWSDGSECSPRDRSPRWGPPEAASSDDGSPVYNNLGGVTTDDSTSDASASNASGAPHPESEASSSSRPPRDAPTPNRPMQHAARPARAPARARRHVVKHRVLKSLAVCGRLSARPAGPGAPEPREPAEPMDLDLYDDDDDAGDDDDDQRSPSRARRLVRSPPTATLAVLRRARLSRRRVCLVCAGSTFPPAATPRAVSARSPRQACPRATTALDRSGTTTTKPRLHRAFGVAVVPQTTTMAAMCEHAGAPMQRIKGTV
mmetsp:Transcript_15942/g.64292  ORF Transcript_15942/g.64292 Transcript_15942/m.64292 type:complete len:287 (-) Transcript_15942:1070-1930(-)